MGTRAQSAAQRRAHPAQDAASSAPCIRRPVGAHALRRARLRNSPSCVEPWARRAKDELSPRHPRGNHARRRAQPRKTCAAQRCAPGVGNRVHPACPCTRACASCANARPMSPERRAGARHGPGAALRGWEPQGGGPWAFSTQRRTRARAVGCLVMASPLEDVAGRRQAGSVRPGHCVWDRKRDLSFRLRSVPST